MIHCSGSIVLVVLPRIGLLPATSMGAGFITRNRQIMREEAITSVTGSGRRSVSRRESKGRAKMATQGKMGKTLPASRVPWENHNPGRYQQKSRPGFT
jgi:hypothetical protein